MHKKKIAISISNDILERIDSSSGKNNHSRSRYIESLIRKGLEAQGIQKAVIMLKKEHHPLSLSAFKGTNVISSQMDFFRAHGIYHVFILTHNSRHIGQIRDYAKGAEIITTNEAGNADALKKIREKMDSDFVVMSGDVYNEFNLRTMAEKHIQSGLIATIGLMSRKMPSEYGNAVLDGDIVTDFQEKPKTPVSHVVNAGVYIFQPSVFNAMRNCHSLEKELFPRLASMRQLLGYFTMGEYQHFQESYEQR